MGDPFESGRINLNLFQRKMEVSSSVASKRTAAVCHKVVTLFYVVFRGHLLFPKQLLLALEALMFDLYKVFRLVEFVISTSCFASFCLSQADCPAK